MKAKKQAHKLLAVVLSVIMILSLVPLATFTAFAETEGLFYYSVYNGEATITGLVDPDTSGAIEIPATIGGYPVTSIGNWALEDCTGLTSVTIPDSVTSIGSWAFYGCTGLESIIIPDSVTSIGYRAFDNTAWYNNQPDGVVYAGKIVYKCKGECPSSVTIKEGTLGIGGNAFSNCNTLETITIPNSVTSIGDYAFSGCTGLESIIIPDSVTSIGSGAFNNTAWYNNQPDGVVYAGKIVYECKGECPSSVTIKDGTLGIGGNAFSNCNTLETITIPDSVTSIGDWAFYGCTELKEINLGKGVKELSKEAFLCCSGLESISVDPANTVYHSAKNSIIETESKTMVLGCKNSVIPSDGSVTSIVYAFFECSGLTSIDIPQTVTSIGSGAFSGCQNLKSVTMHDGVTSIGYRAFCDCGGLEDVTIPSSVTVIEDSAFSGCEGLTSITIPNSVTSIGDQAFAYCYGLTSITIPDSVTSIGDAAFKSCTGLESIAVDSDNSVYHSANNTIIETENKNLVLGCKNSVIPSDGSVTSIGYMAFFNCVGLTGITIPDSVTSIDRFAFSYCTGLTSITIPGGVTLIEYCMLCGCTGLTSITIPDGVTQIGDDAFENCTGLESVIIPDSVTLIGRGAFGSCYGLTDVYYTGTEQDRENITIYDDDYWWWDDNKRLLNATWHYNYVPDSPTACSHTHTEIRNAKEATRTEEGYTGDTYCLDCGEKIADGEIIPKIVIPGDINNDGRVNNKDLTRLFQYLSGWSIEVNESALDINGDGRVNNKDVTRLFQYLSGWDVEIH